jgi:putative membrane protein
MDAYTILKSLHLLFVMAWIACVFYLPRILVNWVEAGPEPPAVRERLLLMGRRLYRFGHHMFGLAAVFGGWLWWQFDLGAGWLHAKLALVALLLAYFVVCGRVLKRAPEHGIAWSARALRWANELPILFVLGVIWLVLAKPF